MDTLEEFDVKYNIGSQPKPKTRLFAIYNELTNNTTHPPLTYRTPEPVLYDAVAIQLSRIDFLNEKIEEQHRYFDNENKKNHQKIVDLEEIIANLQKQIQTQQNDFQQLQNEQLATHLQEVEKKDENIKLVEKNVQDLQEQVHEQQGVISQLRSEINGLEYNLEKDREWISVLSAGIHNKDEDIKELASCVPLIPLLKSEVDIAVSEKNKYSHYIIKLLDVLENYKKDMEGHHGVLYGLVGEVLKELEEVKKETDGFRENARLDMKGVLDSAKVLRDIHTVPHPHYPGVDGVGSPRRLDVFETLRGVNSARNRKLVISEGTRNAILQNYSPTKKCYITVPSPRRQV